MKEYCKIPGCKNLNKSNPGYCRKHYYIWKRFANPLIIEAIHPTNCIVLGCKRKPLNTGFCKLHTHKYQTETLTFSYNVHRITGEKIYTHCTIPGCTKRHSARGLCHMHYMRLIRYGDPTVLKIPCDNSFTHPQTEINHDAKDYCHINYKNWHHFKYLGVM